MGLRLKCKLPHMSTSDGYLKMYMTDRTASDAGPDLESTKDAANSASIVLRILERECKKSGLDELAYFIGLARQVADEDATLYG